jgi:hypothetical protein
LDDFFAGCPETKGQLFNVIPNLIGNLNKEGELKTGLIKWVLQIARTQVALITAILKLL